MQVRYQSYGLLKEGNVELEVLRITKDEYQRNKLDKHEIRLDGKMYDIKEITFINNYVELIAFHDTREEGLISVIEDYCSPSGSKKEFPVQIINLLASVYILPYNPGNFCPSDCSGISFIFFPSTYPAPTAKVLSPPPEFVS